MLSSNSSDPNQDVNLSEHALFVGEEWITRGGENLIWLPKDYRATCQATEWNTLVLGHASGAITVFQFVFP